MVVAIDGGRTRLRENRRRQQRNGKRITRRRRYQAQWREPKLITIFEMDERGRMKHGTRAWIDGTFEGPDHVMELLAYLFSGLMGQGVEAGRNWLARGE